MKIGIVGFGKGQSPVDLFKTLTGREADQLAYREKQERQLATAILADDRLKHLSQKLDNHGKIVVGALVEVWLEPPLGTNDDPDNKIISHLNRLDAVLLAPDDALESELIRSEYVPKIRVPQGIALREMRREEIFEFVVRVSGWVRFYTAAGKNCQLWLAPRGTTVLQAAAIIHTDLARTFIKAEVRRINEDGDFADNETVGRDYVLRSGYLLEIDAGQRKSR